MDNLEQTSEQTTDSAPQVEKSAEGVAQGSENIDSGSFLTVEYNHEEKGLTQEEAKAYAQKGMNYDKVAEKLKAYEGYDPILKSVAAAQKMTVDEFVNGLQESIDSAELTKLKERFGDDQESIDTFFRIYKEDQQKAIDDFHAAEQKKAQELDEKIAAEFLELKKTYGLEGEFTDLPEDVRRAVYEGKNLEHSYLRDRFLKEAKVNSVTAKQNENKNRTVGNITGAANGGNSVIDELIAGIHS